ncbi:MAG TPA: SET domain-containing protein-lysine N-methyltransferase [Thiotrichaceae bacterium]|nr:SET domain-containing protein-lysine N-methyltransferase [Thiotrichaceae bacterium]
MIYPHTKVLHFDNNRGFGVCATQFIPKGTLLWLPYEEVDKILSVEQVSAMSKSEREVLTQFTYLTNEGQYILSYDNGRYVNHSCDANSISIAGLELSIAIRDIQQDEEISEDYGLYYANGGFDDCLCGSSKCRHKICEDDIRQYGDEWDHKIASVFYLIPKVEQPLWQFISSKLREQIEAILANKISFPSCKILKCSPDELQKAANLLWPSIN